jgi:hypothetical protein
MLNRCKAAEREVSCQPTEHSMRHNGLVDRSTIRCHRKFAHVLRSAVLGQKKLKKLAASHICAITKSNTVTLSLHSQTYTEALVHKCGEHQENWS